jgi:hypothetical protein
MSKIVQFTDLSSEAPGPRAVVPLPLEFEVRLLVQPGLQAGDPDDRHVHDELEGLEPL